MKMDAKILVVDDLPSARKILTRQLSKLGYSNVKDVCDGEAAFKLAEQEFFDLIISDWLMPKMNGIELLEKLSKLPSANDTKFLFISSAKTKDEIIQAFKQGVRSYLSKPFSTEMLKEKLLQLSNEEHETNTQN